MNVPLNIDWQQILLHMFNFVILFGALYFLLYSPVKNFMDKRKAFYEDMDKKAKAELEEASKVRLQCEERLEGLAAELENRKKEFDYEVNAEREKVLASAHAEADFILANAHKKAESEHDTMLENARKEITDIVSETAAKLAIGSDVSNTYDAFLNSAKKD